MFTLEQIRSWTPKELERRVYALAADAGAFSVPEVQAIMKKVYLRRTDERDHDYGTKVHR
jgi:hypothetical protein